MGGRKFVLVGLEPIGCTPYAILTNGRVGSCVEEWNAAGFIFNDRLKSLVDILNDKFPIDSKFIFINSTSQFLQYSPGNNFGFLKLQLTSYRLKTIYLYLIKSCHVPWISGFPVSNAACCPSIIAVCIPNQSPCSDRNEYVFWDQLHFTEEWNLVIAITSYNASNPLVTYPMDIKHLVDYEFKMRFELKNGSTTN